MIKLKQIIRDELQSLIDKKQLGPKWSITKKHIAELCKIRANVTPTCTQISDAIKELSDEFPFLMKCPNGYHFPESETQWRNYASGKHSQALGMLNQAQKDFQKNYNTFKTLLNAGTKQPTAN